MRRYGVIATVLFFGMSLPSLLHAQAARNAKEAVTNESQIVRDKAQMSRDQQEITDFSELLVTMDEMQLPDEWDGFRKINRKLLSSMKRECDQAKTKVALANREVRQSLRELRGERREVRRSGRVVDHVQAGDDRRDARDDTMDRAAAKERSTRMSELYTQCDELQMLMLNGDNRAFVKNRRALGEFLSLMRSDLRATFSELTEDRRERREDRRERLTDAKK